MSLRQDINVMHILLLLVIVNAVQLKEWRIKKIINRWTAWIQWQIPDFHCMWTCRMHITHQIKQIYKAENCKQSRVNVKLLSLLYIYNTIQNSSTCSPSGSYANVTIISLITIFRQLVLDLTNNDFQSSQTSNTG